MSRWGKEKRKLHRAGERAADFKVRRDHQKRRQLLVILSGMILGAVLVGVTVGKVAVVLWRLTR